MIPRQYIIITQTFNKRLYKYIYICSKHETYFTILMILSIYWNLCLPPPHFYMRRAAISKFTCFDKNCGSYFSDDHLPVLKVSFTFIL